LRLSQPLFYILYELQLRRRRIQDLIVRTYVDHTIEKTEFRLSQPV